jgi:hypothetical protein
MRLRLSARCSGDIEGGFFFFFRECFFNGREDGRTVLCYKYVYTSPLEGTVDIPSRFTITMP